IDCATALSSSISKTRMPVPYSRRSGRQVGRTCGTQNAFEQLIRILTGTWLTNTDSSSQALTVQFLSNRPKILRRSSFSLPCSFKFHIKRRAEPTPPTRPSSDGRALSVTKDSDAMINDAGKHEVKRPVQKRG